MTPEPITTDVNWWQSQNASAPMDVTELGIVMVVKLPLKKAKGPIEVTVLGMVIEVIPQDELLSA